MPISQDMSGMAPDAGAPAAVGVIERLAVISRGSCSDGERAAAELIAEELRACGATVELEEEPATGSLWWPLGLTCAAGVAAAGLALRGRRAPGVWLGAVATGLAADDLLGTRGVARRALARRRTTNVVARAGDPTGNHALVIVCHHDAARSGVFFNPRIGRWLSRRVGPGRSRRRLAPPATTPIVLGPALVAIGATTGLRAVSWIGAAVCAGIVGAFADIARHPVVPGANDNLSGVATLIAVAAAVRARPPAGLRVILVSTGAEESLMEGMRGFIRRHRSELHPDRARVLCVDTVGCPHLTVSDAEGMLRARPHDPELMSVIDRCAGEAGIAVVGALALEGEARSGLISSAR